jgi:hypothetical protein
MVLVVTRRDAGKAQTLGLTNSKRYRVTANGPDSYGSLRVTAGDRER